MKQSSLRLELRDSVFEPGTATLLESRASSRSALPTILYDESVPDRPRYKVWLYVDGPDLPYVQNVIYTLHHTFPDPVRSVPRSASNPYCALAIWTWGLFDVVAQVEDKSGGLHMLEHTMRYDQDLKRSGVHYKRTEPA